MADQTATFTINLKDGTSGSANDAARALQRLQAQLQRDQKELGALQKAMKNLQGGTSVNIQTFKALEKQIHAKKEAIASAQASYLQLGGSLADVAKRSRGTGAAFSELAGHAQSMGGPLGNAVGGLSRIAGMVGGGGLALGLVAVAAAFIGITVAVLAATKALLSFGLAAATARRNEMLMLEGLTKARNWYGIAAGKASDLQASIDRVSGSTALGREQITGFASDLYRAGLRGENLNQALEGLAIATAAGGEAQGALYKNMAMGARFSGQSIKRLTDDVKARFGEIAARQMLSLDVQSKKLRENFARIFDGLKIEGFGRAVAKVTELFSQNTASGRALKQIVETLFQPLIDGASSAGPIVRRFIQGMIIGFQRIIIHSLEIRLALKRAFGDSDVLKNLDLVTVAVTAGKVAMGLFAGAAVAAAGGVLLFAASIGIVVGAAAAFFGVFLYPLYAAYNLIAGLDWDNLGSSLVDGLIGGVVGDASKLFDAIKNLGSGAIAAFKAVLGIHSPSRVFFEAGMNVAKGTELGVDAGAPGAQRAAAELVDVPKGGAAGGRGGVVLNLGGIVVNATGDAKAIAADLQRELEKVLETVARQMAVA